MGGIDITCLKKKNKDQKKYQNNYCQAKKSQYNNEWNIFLIVIVVLIVFFYLRFNNICDLFRCKFLNPYIYATLDRLAEIKA